MNDDNTTAAIPQGAPAKQRNWDLRRRIVAVLFLPAIVIATLVVSIPVALFFLSDPTAIPIQVAVGISLVAELLVVLWAVLYGGLRPLSDMLYLKLRRWWHVPLGFAVGLMGYGVLQLLAISASALSGEQIESSDTSVALGGLTGLWGALFLVLVVGILAPTVEELLFRGTLIGALQHSSWNRKWLSVVLSAVFFGALHIQGFSNLTDVLIFLWVMVMGGVFAALLLTTKSLWTSVSAHIGYNIVTSVVLIVGMGA